MDKRAGERIRSVVETNRQSTPPMPLFTTMGTQGAYKFVYIELPDSLRTDRDPYLRVAEHLCQNSKSVCGVKFWDDGSVMARSLPMTDEQFNTMVAEYHRNLNTGHEHLYTCDRGNCKDF